MESAVSIALAKKVCCKSFGPSVIRFTSSMKDVTAPRMTSQALDILLCSVLLAMKFCSSIWLLEDEKTKRSVWAVGIKTWRRRNADIFLRFLRFQSLSKRFFFSCVCYNYASVRICLSKKSKLLFDKKTGGQDHVYGGPEGRANVLCAMRRFLMRHSRCAMRYATIFCASCAMRRFPVRRGACSVGPLKDL